MEAKVIKWFLNGKCSKKPIEFMEKNFKSNFTY
ncbi:hypothetical protein B4U80_03332 [Leptotrombidium deliense]|uniref:Uncharacterized protein n=1 Tax=Leptotrombidium deliense TaxID=299467 RepID=A0A443RWK4_9ACAR|nr:hypothetical protein B4U80_03332 [Leptotrombidium deliense]